jgi:hypothetical protein
VTEAGQRVSQSALVRAVEGFLQAARAERDLSSNTWPPTESISTSSSPGLAGTTSWIWTRSTGGRCAAMSPT